MPSSTTAKLANTCSSVSKQTALVPQIKRIEQFKFDAPDWKDVAELKSAWAKNQRDLANVATASMDKQAEVYICLAKSHAILSQRGDKYAKMRDEAGILNPKTGKRLTWTVVTSAEVAEITCSGDRATGVRMADGREFRANIVVSDAGATNTFGRLLPRGTPVLETLRRELRTLPRPLPPRLRGHRKCLFAVQAVLTLQAL